MSTREDERERTRRKKERAIKREELVEERNRREGYTHDKKKAAF